MSEKLTLKQWRNLRGLTQEELGFKAGLTSRSIANYEKDVENLRNAKYSKIKKIAEVLNIKVNDIFLGANSEKPK